MVYSLPRGVLGGCGSPNEAFSILVSKWETPSFPFYKVNVDGVVFKEKKKKEVGVGVVIWDHVGNFIASLNKKFRCPLGAIEVEAKAFESSLEFAKYMGVRFTWYCSCS